MVYIIMGVSFFFFFLLHCNWYSDILCTFQIVIFFSFFFLDLGSVSRLLRKVVFDFQARKSLLFRWRCMVD